MGRTSYSIYLFVLSFRVFAVFPKRVAGVSGRCVCLEWRGVNQAYSRLATIHMPYHRLQVRFGGVCRCMRGDFESGPVLFGPNHLRPTIFGCQGTDSIPPQVSRKESLRPFILTPSRPVG